MRKPEELIEMLHAGGYSWVVEGPEGLHTFVRRGVVDLYDLYRTHPDCLAGAHLADKVVGKGAAALMVLGGVAWLYTDVVSTPALVLLREGGVVVEFAREVPYIENRTKTGRCPLESLCDGKERAEEIYPLIQQFMAERRESGPELSASGVRT